MSFIDWLVVAVSPFMFAAILYFLKDQRDDIIKNLKAAKDEQVLLKNEIRELQKEIYESIIEAKKLNDKTSGEIIRLANELIKINETIAIIKTHDARINESREMIKNLYGRVHVIDDENTKQSVILKILIDKLKLSP